MDPRNDRTVVLAVVVGLILTVLTVLGSAVYLISVGRTMPTDLIILGSTALGALTALLATTSTKPTPAQIQAGLPTPAETPAEPDPGSPVGTP